MRTTYESRSESETRRIARTFAQTLRPGDVVALYGGLGSGKTQFVKGVCEAFGVTGHVASPTYVLQSRYEGTLPAGQPILLYHFDLYRLRTAEEIYDFGYEEFLFGDGICLVEWAERLGPLLPPTRYDVTLDLGGEEHVRHIAIVSMLSAKDVEGKLS